MRVAFYDALDRYVGEAQCANAVVFQAPAGGLRLPWRGRQWVVVSVVVPGRVVIASPVR